MLTVVILFLWASILLYVLLGGADFGAGILELLSPSRETKLTRRLTFKAIGPIWEANHMWLVITVVILFVGFPAIYTMVSTYLHIPLLLLLMGIVARGTALSFRSNDAIKDDLQLLYSRIFVAASLITPLVLGIIAGSLAGRYINPAAATFSEAYLDSWLHRFPLAVGGFTEALCAWLASIYLIARSDNAEDKRLFLHHALVAHLVLAACGIVMLLAAKADQLPLDQWLSGNHLSRLTLWGAGALYMIIGWLLLRRYTYLLTACAILLVTMLYFSATCTLFPNMAVLRNGMTLSLTTAASWSSINALGWALLAGSLLIFPSLFYLIHIFEGRAKQQNV